MKVPVIDLNSSPARCEAVPVPKEAMSSLPGDLRARETSSLTLFAGTEGWITRPSGAVPTIPTAVKSATGSKDTLETAGLIACVLAVAIKRV